MTKILFALLLAFSGLVRAQELGPFIDYLRSTPAFVNGEVKFNADSTLYQEGWSIVKIVKNQPIDFSFKENWLQVKPGNGFYVKYAGLRVYINSVTWTPSGGVVTDSNVPVDITGLSRGAVSREVAQVIADLFGEKIKRANRILNTIRRQRTLDSTFKQARSMIDIFTAGENTVTLPNYRGEIGLNFIPSNDKVFYVYGNRVGIRAYDAFRAGFSFTGNKNGIYPYNMVMTSRNGIDINQGREWKALMRVSLSKIGFDANGIDFDFNLGATQILGAMCARCTDAAKFPAARLKVESAARKAMLDQAKVLWPYLPGMNVSRNVMNSFLKRENCTQANLACLIEASGDSRDIQTCTSKLRACAR